MKAKDVVKDIEDKEFQKKREFAEREVEYSMSRIKSAEKCIEDNKEYIKRLEKKLRKAKKKHAKLLDKDINDFEPKSYITFGNNRAEITNWTVTFDSLDRNCRCATLPTT